MIPPSPKYTRGMRVARAGARATPVVAEAASYPRFSREFVVEIVVELLFPQRGEYDVE